MTVSRRQTRRERDTIDTAYHEAGHAAIALVLGFEVSSVRLTGERATVGRQVGRTQLALLPLLTTDEFQDPSFEEIEVAITLPDERGRDLFSLAGDAVEFRRNTKAPGHVNEVVDRVGQSRFDELWVAAKQLVDSHWPLVDAIATEVLSRPDLALYQGDLATLRDDYLTARVTATRPDAIGRYQTLRQAVDPVCVLTRTARDDCGRR